VTGVSEDKSAGADLNSARAGPLRGEAQGGPSIANAPAT
jgi:hypothetical protein